MCNHCHENIPKVKVHHTHHNHTHEHSANKTNKSLVIQILLTVIAFSVVWIIKPRIELTVSIFTITYLFIGFDIFKEVIENLKTRNFLDENFLMAIASFGAYTLHDYAEAIMVLLLYKIGEHLQDKAVLKSRKSITELMDLRPDYANIETNGKIEKVSPQMVHIGDIILVAPGEKVPLDGTIIEGCAFFDTSALTGETLPKSLNTGEKVLSGFVNTNSTVKIKVEKTFENSTAAKILELVERAGTKKAPQEKFITKFAKYYTPAVVAGALLLALIPPLFTGAGFAIWIKRALTFLVISCPCALVISIPLSFYAGIGCASRNGILIKGSCFLEAITKPFAIVLDKTGTLTKGDFTINKIMPENGYTQEDILKIAAIAQKHSSHPIAKAIKTAVNASDDYAENTLQEYAGMGICASDNKQTILVGNSKLMAKFNIETQIQDIKENIIYVAQNNKFIGSIIISDVIKPSTNEAIQKLKKLTQNIEMLTGDKKEIAEEIAAIANIPAFYAELSPQNKVERIEEIIYQKDAGSSVIFVGDGINDAPVLTRADVGIAMGGIGSDAAIEAADIVIMDDNLNKIAASILIAQKTIKIVKQNIIFAIGVKILFLLLGSFGLISLWGAVFADVGVALLAILNALRTFYTRIPL